MKHYLLTILLSLFATITFAVPARQVKFTHIQKDGTTLTLQNVGDETLHYYINIATGEKMYRGADGDFHALKQTVLADMQTMAIQRRQQNAERRSMRMAKMSNSANSPARVGAVGGMTGQKKGIVILVNFSDKSFNSTHNQTLFDDMFNKEGFNQFNHIGSVHDYFYDQSYGQFDLSFDVIGPVKVSNTMAYYGGNDYSGNDKHPAAMVIEACNLANAQGVNFADYDWDGDGYVDQVFVIYAGYGEASGGAANTIWPHEWNLSSAGYYGDGTGALTLDGVKIDTYACSCELTGGSGSSLMGIGTACHEFSHCLGYPDYYDTDYSGGIGMDSFDVMCSGSYNGPSGNGEVPCGYTAYERMCAGWLTPVELTTPANISNMKNIGTSPEAYIQYNSRNTNEFLMYENRQANRWFTYFSSSAAGHGLFVTHINYDASAWNNNRPNDTPSLQRMTWIPADKKYGTYSSYYGWSVYESDAKGDFFPGTKNVTELGATSHASYYGKWFNGTPTAIKPISEITEKNGEISFKFDGGVLDDGSRYTVTFDVGTGKCGTESWTQTSFEEAVQLPICTIDVPGWQFAGWSLQSVSESAVGPSLLTGTFTPASDCTLYAVYKKVEGLGYKWKQMAASDVTEGGEYAMLTTDGHAFNGEITKGHGQVTSTAFKFDKNGYSTSAPDDICILTVTPVAGGYTMYQADKGYLYAKASESGNLAWQTTENSYWYCNVNDWMYKAVNALLRDYNNNSFRTYGTALGNTIQFAKKISTVTYDSTPIAILPGDVNGDGVINVSDLTALISSLNGNTPSAFISKAADINCDGNVDVDDVMALVVMCMGGE